MEEEIYQILNEIMKMTHNTVGYLISQARMEIRKEKSRINDDLLLEKQFELLHKKYIELRDSIEDYKKGITEMISEDFGLVQTMKTTDPSKNETLILDAREMVMSYIRDSYSSMDFSTDVISGNPSIYDGTPFRELRELEFDLYRDNIINLENRNDVEAVKDLRFGFFEGGIILEDLIYKKVDEKGYEKISKIVEEIENDKFRFNSDTEKERIRRKLIVLKYMQKYLMLNQKYNGVVTSDLKNYSAIQFAADNNSLNLFLGISDEDVQLREEAITAQNLGGLKDDIRSIFRDERDKKPTIRVTIGKRKKLSIKSKNKKDNKSVAQKNKKDNKNVVQENKKHKSLDDEGR